MFVFKYSIYSNNHYANVKYIEKTDGQRDRDRRTAKK